MTHTSRFTPPLASPCSPKLHRLFIHGEDDATGLADDALVGAEGVDAKGAGSSWPWMWSGD
jgi:hypothetical protein